MIIIKSKFKYKYANYFNLDNPSPIYYAPYSYILFGIDIFIINIDFNLYILILNLNISMLIISI